MYKFFRYWKNCLLHGEEYAMLVEQAWMRVNKYGRQLKRIAHTGENRSKNEIH